jgi:hypothetical protein
MAFSPQQHTSLLRDGLDFVPESDFRYLPINVRLKLVELEKTNGQVYLPKNEAASLKREVAAEKMSEVAKRNDPDAYFGGDPEYSSTPITDDPAELKGRLGTDEYGTRPTIYRAIEPEGAVFNNRYLTSGQYESQYKESDPTIYGRYTPTKKGDEILLPPTANKDDPDADRINETEPHEYMHRGMMPTNWLSKYLLGPIDSISEKIGVGNLFGTRVFAGNQHTYIAKALAEDKQKKQIADFERQTSKLSERELAILKKYLESERNKLQLEKNRINKANGDEAKSLSESEEYKRRLKKLENFISKNRLVSKEAQMSAMSEGSYKDPRFLNTTGHPLIDQYGMHPFPAEGSGQILSTTDLGMEGPESMFGRSLYGQYNPKEDTIIYKDLDKNIEGHKDYTSKEDTQKHELVHRTARRSGWLDNFYNSSYLNDNAKLISGSRGKMLSPLINEALAHSYETLDKEELKKQIRFRASKFNLKEPDKIADEIFNNIEYLKNDFENHLEEINPNLTKYTRIKKATGGEANNLQAALDMLQKPVPNIIKAPEKKDKKKSLAAALIELEVDPVFRVPTNVKTFVDSVLLNKKDNITNKNFSNSELKVVKDLIVESANNKNVYTESLENPFNPLNYIPEGKKTSAKRAKMLDDMKGGDLTTPGYVDYNTYNKKTGLGSINSSPGFHSVFSDTGRVLTTLGQFNYSILPNGDVQVTDTYDFNPMLLDDQGQESKRANAFTNSELSVLSGGYYPLRKLGEKLLPEREGKGRKINIVLPKDLFSKEEYSSIKNLTNSRIKKATGGEANNLQAAIDLLNNPVTSSISPLGDPTLSPLMESLQKNPIDDFAMMMASPVKKVTSAARLAQLANPTDEVFETVTRKELLDYIKTIPLKERLALRANDSIPLNGKYAILDHAKLNFYEDIVDLSKLPKNFKAGDNTLAKIYMEKNNIPSRVDITEPLAGFKPRPYFEEIIDFKKGTEKIKLSFPKTGVLQPYGAQTAYRTKTLTNPSKEQLDKLFKGMREKDLQKQLDGLRKAKSIESDPGSTLGDLAEAAKLRRSMPYKTSDDIAKELLELQGVEKLDTDLLAILRKQYNL